MADLHRLPDSLFYADDNCEINFDTRELEGRLNYAQYALDSTVMTHMIPYMPMVTGTFIQLTKAQSAAWAGTGKVCAAIGSGTGTIKGKSVTGVPYGRFLYEGKVMVGISSRSPWAKKGEMKIVTAKNLTYSGSKAGTWITNKKGEKKFAGGAHPLACDHWFEKAERRYSKNWEQVVGNALAKGKRR